MTAREEVIAAARSVFSRGLTHGSTGNISVRTADGILVTPTGSSLGTVRAEQLSLIDLDGRHIDGPAPSKEAFLHAAMLRARPTAGGVVHTHSTHAAAVSCMDGLDEADALPPLTAYFAMRVGRLPLLPYFAPGDSRLMQVAESMAREHSSLLLRNHGPIAAGATLSGALDAIEELEATAKVFLVLRGERTRPLTTEQRDALIPRN